MKNNITTTLYIIGNGFDLAHGIPSSYSHFRDYCQKHNQELYNLIERFYPNPEEFWAAFETNLKNIDADMIIDWCQLGNGEWNTNYKDFYRFTDEVKNTVDNIKTSIVAGFHEWIHSLYVDCQKAAGLYSQDALFLNFNYTKTLEKSYGISEDRILHIHGISDTEIQSLVFGHNASFEELIYKTEGDNEFETDSRREIANVLMKLVKPTEEIIAQNHVFFDALKDVDLVICLGVSYNSIDMPYFDKIRNSVKQDAHWICSVYSDDDKKNLQSFSKHLQLTNLSSCQISNFSDPRIQLSFDI